MDLERIRGSDKAHSLGGYTQGQIAGSLDSDTGIQGILSPVLAPLDGK